MLPRPAPIALLLPALLACGACGDREEAAGEPKRFSGRTMGTTYSVQYFGDPAVAGVRREIEAFLAGFDEVFSTYRPDSEVSRFNAHRSTEPFTASEELRTLVSRARRLSEWTGGAFDITIKPLRDLYDRYRDSGEAPGPEELAAARARIGWRRLEVTGGALVKERPDLEIDVDAIAKGAGVDGVAAALRSHGLRSFAVEIGGEVYCGAPKPDGTPWRFGVENPALPGRRAEVLETAALEERAMATSGTYVDYNPQAPEDDPLRHHILDPREGREVPVDLLSVAVVAEDCTVADALATAFTVLGAAETKRLLGSPPLGGRGLRVLLCASGEGGLVVDRAYW